MESRKNDTDESICRARIEMQMDLETVIQNEVSQKEKNKYRILMHICGI